MKDEGKNYKKKMQTTPLTTYRCFLPNLAGFVEGASAWNIIHLWGVRVKVLT